MRNLLAAAALLCAAAAASAEPWDTYRGDPQRTGCPDGKPGPAAPKVLWAMKSKEHFIASPVPHKSRLFASGLSFINTSTFYSLDPAPAADKRIVWTRQAPDLELPSVSSPAVSGGRLIFGDGMHQTSGASLYALDLDKGGLLWQLKVEGELVHLEGSPTVADGKVYLGGGAAGVLCVDPGKLSLDGKEMAPAVIAKAIDVRRADLKKKYEEAKAKGDKFAVPPTERDLPRATPAVAWQAGKVKWHVDAPVAVVGGKVLAASAYLDKEKVGERALFCLDAASGKGLWSAPLAINPWGGPSVQGDVVVVSGSSIAYDPAALKGAKGVVAAFGLSDGKPKWKKDLPGGVLSCAALSKESAFVTCTDGKVRSYSLDKGAIRWTYAGKAAFFGPPALAGDTVYAADLEGVVHAINARTGASKWKLELATDPAVMAPGMAYAGPVLADGRLYVATCNLVGDNDQKKGTAVVCVGEK